MPGQKKLTTQRQSQKKKKKIKSCQTKAKGQLCRSLGVQVSIRQHRQCHIWAPVDPGALALTPSGGEGAASPKSRTFIRSRLAGLMSRWTQPGAWPQHCGRCRQRHSSRCDFEEDTESCRGSWGASGTRSQVPNVRLSHCLSLPQKKAYSTRWCFLLLVQYFWLWWQLLTLTASN